MTTTAHEQDQTEAFRRSRPAIVLVNRDRHPMPVSLDILPPEMKQRLQGAPPRFLMATREEVDRVGIVLAHDHLAAFLKGEPVLLVVDAVTRREPLGRGRRRKEELERRIQDALAMQVYVGTERLRTWVRLRDGHRAVLTVPESRSRVIELVAQEGWVDEECSVASESERASFFEAQFDAGSRLVTSWYPWASRPDDLSSTVQRIVEDSTVILRDSRLLTEAIDREISMVRFMLRCQREATRQVLAAHAMSAELRDHDRVSRGQLAVLAGAALDRPTLFEAVRAALDGDFDPSSLFRSLLSHSRTFELARRLGWHGRGHDARLEPELVVEMRRQFDLRDQLDGRLADGADPVSMTDEEATALTLTQAASELFSRDAWMSVLSDALETGDAVALTQRRA